MRRKLLKGWEVKMNILMVGPTFDSKGGIASVITNFKNHYKNNLVFYFDTWQENGRVQMGVTSFFKINTKIKKENIDIVHFHVAQKGSFYRKSLLALKVRKNTKVFFHMHASQFDTFYKDANPLIQRYIRQILNKLDGLVVLSEEWARFYRTLTNTKIVVIENAVEIPDENSYNVQANTIVTLGRIGNRKGSYDILNLAKKIQPVFPNVQFVLYGDGNLTMIGEQIAKQFITNVHIGGWIDKIEQKEVMKTSVLHLLPSYQEGLPMSILETMSYGIPNLTSNVGGIPQVIEDGKNGMMVDPGDVETMFERLSIFLKNEEIRSNYSKEAYQMIQNKFSIEIYFEKWNQYYNDLMKLD